jgi:4'-phosphopantetheinyl transferase
VIYRALLKYTSTKTIADESHTLGELLLSYGLLLEKGIVYRNEPIIQNPWGKPSLKSFPGIYYNVSHCENLAACIISDKCPVGIDIEKIRSFSPYTAKRICRAAELQKIYSMEGEDADREFFRYWTLKESFIKAIGMGLTYPVKNIYFDIGRDGKIHSNCSECSFQLIEDTEGFITAVCYRNILGRK